MISTEHSACLATARFADDLVILVDSHPRQQWLRGAVEKRLREELTKLQVEVNEEKSRKVDLQEGGSFGFLGFEFRRIRSHRGRWMPLHKPKGKKRMALLRKLKTIFRSFRSRPVSQLIEQINPILRGWVNYFAIGGDWQVTSFACRHAPPQLVEEIFEKDHVALRLLLPRGLGRHKRGDAFAGEGA